MRDSCDKLDPCFVQEKLSLTDYEYVPTKTIPKISYTKNTLKPNFLKKRRAFSLSRLTRGLKRKMSTTAENSKVAKQSLNNSRLIEPKIIQNKEEDHWNYSSTSNLIKGDAPYFKDFKKNWGSAPNPFNQSKNDKHGESSFLISPRLQKKKRRFGTKNIMELRLKPSGSSDPIFDQESKF